MWKDASLKGLLVLLAVLLAANLMAVLLRPPGDSVAVSALVPSAQAGQVMRLDSEILVTTNQQGDQITIWQLGRYVDGGYESAKSRTYTAAATTQRR
ncbi:MAG: hypothetical protein RLY93_11705 [Sumerlaeia bacterium]